jgi:dGTPase
MLEENERKTFSPYAQLSSRTQGRERDEEPCPIRPAFQRDRDRILHSKAFRRLIHKTQVFLSPWGDHYRTRLTHTLEVSQIGRTIAKALRLNEDLTEAVALGHDLGHTPFGHAGEDVLNEIMPEGFSHHEQSLRVVSLLENNGSGLNLTLEVRDGILKHSKGRRDFLSQNEVDPPRTLEAEVIRAADVIAYINHDIDDALRAEMLREDEIPSDCTEVLGHTHSSRISTMVFDIISQSGDSPHLQMSEPIHAATLKLRDFLFERVYLDPLTLGEMEKASHILRELFAYFVRHLSAIPGEILKVNAGSDERRAVCDFLAGMTDRYAMMAFERLFLPQPWMIL